MNRGIHVDTQQRNHRAAPESVDNFASVDVWVATVHPSKRAEQRVRVTILGHVSRRTLVAGSLAEDALILRRRGWTASRIARTLGVGKRSVERWLA